MNNIKNAIEVTLKDFIYKILAISFGLNFLALDYMIFSQSSTFRISFSQNTIFYNWTTIILSIITAILFAISITMLIYIFKKQADRTKESAPSTALGALFGALASGCPVCGAWLLPLLGIAGSLAAFPLQGLEIKVLAIGLLVFSIYQSTNIVLGICNKDDSKKNNRNMIIVLLVFIIILITLPNLPSEFKIKFQRNGIEAPTEQQIKLDTDLSNLYDQVNPIKGFTINAKYNNIGYALVEAGVIDFDKFSQLYDNAGTPLTKEQLKIFTKEGLDKEIMINRENSYFLLNLFWAFGLANDNPIITQGQITKYGKSRVGDFASTGGWTIAKKPLEEYIGELKLAVLSDEQQALLLKVAESTYRPCCGNSTAFPDCNHGMALLGMLELLASSGANEAELYQAAKYFSAYWFPTQAMDVATYFKMTEDVDFADIDPKTFVSKEFFSGRGWSNLKGWLNNNLINNQQQSAPRGGGCGVESGAPVRSIQQKKQPRPITPQGGGGCGV